jgi:four helix bundle protein
MEQGNLEHFGAYQKSLQLYEFVVDDVFKWIRDPRCSRLASQQLASADSICSNIEEGFGRESTKEYRHFLVIARGSTRETAGRYSRLRHWIPEPIIEERVALAAEIGRILTATINRLKG